MELLPPLVPARPRLVLCGHARADGGRPREHYYATPGNAFWQLVHASGLTPRRLAPHEDAVLPAYGVGLTDLAGRRGPEDTTVWDVAGLVADVERWRPAWVGLTSKTVGELVARGLGHRPPRLGPQDWQVAGAEVFVLPGTSGANRRADYDGRPDRLAWWSELAQLVEATVPEAAGPVGGVCQDDGVQGRSWGAAP